MTASVWTVLPYDLPLPRPIKTAQGIMARRQGFWLALATDTGLHWGEAAIWPGFGDGLDACKQTLLAAGFLTPEAQALREVTFDSADWPMELRAAVAQAQSAAAAQAQDVPLCRLFAKDAAVGVTTHALVDSAYAAQCAVAAGAKALKIKVGVEALDEEGARVMAIRSAVGPHVALRLDANGAYDPQVGTQAARLFAAACVQWLEQPVAAGDVQGLAHVRAHGGVPIYADEAVSNKSDLTHLLACQAIDGIVIKPAFVGGPKAAFELGQMALSERLGVAVTHALESPIGRLGALHVALALGPGVACGLAGGLLNDAMGPWQHHNHTLACPRQPGLGLVPGGWAPVPNVRAS